MPKTAVISARIDPELKHDAEDVFRALGLSATQAITLFYRQVELERGLPFAVRLPNDETAEALELARTRQGLDSFNTLEDLLKDLGDLMKAIRRTSQFKQDVRRMQRQGKDLDKLKSVLASLVLGEEPSPEYRDHVLVGQYKGTRECNLEPDWLLIYEQAESECVLIRTGSHSDLFR